MHDAPLIDKPQSAFEPWSRAGDSPEESSHRARWVLVFVAVHAAVYLTRVMWLQQLEVSPPELVALGCGWAAVLAMVLRRRVVASTLLFAGLLTSAVLLFPFTANHGGLFVLLSLLLLVHAPDANDRALIGALRIVVALVFLWAGIQKLWYGYYFEAEFFAEYAHSKVGFAELFRRFSPDNAATVLNLNPSQPGAGPFRSSSVALILLANFSWFIELLVPAALLKRRAWTAAALSAAAFTYAIQAFAREFTFGLLFGGLMGVFLPLRWFRWQVVATVVIDLVLLGFLLTGGGERWHFN